MKNPTVRRLANRCQKAIIGLSPNGSDFKIVFNPDLPDCRNRFAEFRKSRTQTPIERFPLAGPHFFLVRLGYGRDDSATIVERSSLANLQMLPTELTRWMQEHPLA